MAAVKAGIVTEKELEGPMDVGSSDSLFDLSSPSTWAFLWFLIAVLLLFIL